MVKAKQIFLIKPISNKSKTKTMHPIFFWLNIKASDIIPVLLGYRSKIDPLGILFLNSTKYMCHGCLILSIGLIARMLEIFLNKDYANRVLMILIGKCF